MRKDAPGQAPGFSLVETMVALAVAAVLLGLALPGFRELIQARRSSAASQLLVTELALARNTAIVQRTPVTVCPSRGDGLCSGDTDWSAGWIMYRDPARRAQPRTAADILHVSYQPVHPSVRIQTTAGRLRVRYQPAGFSGGSNLTLRICTGQRLRGEVIVNNAGRPRIRPVEDGFPCPV